MGKLLCLRFQEAVAQSSLDRETRHLLMTMALLADWRTGVGTASQATIAQAMGCTDRYVRQLLTDLAERKETPVTVTRRRRGAAAGRTSDQYTLQFAPQEDAGTRSGTHVPARDGEPSGTCIPAEAATRSGTPLPLGEPFKLVPQPEQHDSRTGTPRHPNRNARSEDQISSDLDQISSSAPRKEKRARASRAKTDEKQPVEGAHELKLHYVAECERTTGTKPEFGKGWGRAVKAFSDLVTAYGLDTAKRIVTGALEAQWGSKTPWAIRDNAVNYLQGRTGTAARGFQPQRGVASGDDPTNYGREAAREYLGGGE